MRSPISSSTVLITGTARDVSGYIHSEINHLSLAFKEFKNVHIFIVESDSRDDTVQKLENMRSMMANFTYLSLGNLSEKIPSRTERIAFCRNKIIEEVTSNPKYSDVDFIAMADLDGLNSLINAKKITQCWKVEQDWGAIFANQAEYYYDIYALRHPLWSNLDCLMQQQKLSPIIGSNLSHFLAIKSKQVCLPERLGLIEVDSAFGGFGIYKKTAFLSGWYSGRENQQDICEHVTFHRMLRSKKYMLYINCALINCDKPCNPNDQKKKRYLLSAIKHVGCLVLGKDRFKKYLNFLQS